MCAECVLQASMHPKATHTVRMLDAAAATLAGKLETLVPTLGGGSASLAALTEKLLLQKAVMTHAFESSVESLKASVAAFVAKLLAAQDALIQEARTTLNAHTKILDDQASVFSVSAAQVRAGFRMCEEVLTDASQRVDPLALAITLDSANSLAHLAGRRASTDVPPSIVVSMDLKPLEAVLAGICHVHQSHIDVSLCEVAGPGLEGFVVGDAADADVVAQNYVDVTLKDAHGTVVADISLDDINAFVTDGQPSTGAGSVVSLVPIGTVAKAIHSSGCIRVSFSTSTPLPSFALHLQSRGGDVLACSPVI